MSTKRAWSASIVLNDKTLLVTGGMTTWGFPLSSTEQITDGGTSEPGPVMPSHLAGHAHVAINSTDSLLIGM